MSSLKQKRGNAKGRLTRAADFVVTIETSTTIEMLEIRLKTLEQAWDDFTSLHNELVGDANDDEFVDLEVEFGTYEDKFFTAQSGLMKSIRERQSVANQANKTAIEQLAQQQSSFLEILNTTPRTTSSSVKLQPITIQPFSGNYKDWPTFRDLFTSTVDSKPDLTATQKFHYLKSFLRDTAFDLVKTIPVSETNYIEAWERLEQRYDRVNIIAQSYIQSFLSLPTTTVSNVQLLRSIIDGADEIIRGLNSINQTGRDPWLMYLLLNKIDNDSRQAWATEVGSRDDCFFDELLRFLQLRCDALESCQSVNRSSTSRQKSIKIKAHFAESTETHLKCPKCQGPHILPQCPDFVALNIESRRNFAKTKSLCFNCLRVGHSSVNCRSTFRCRMCQSRHHSLVHAHQQEGIPAATSTSKSSPASSPSSCKPLTASTSTPSIVNNHSLELGHRQTILPTLVAKVQDKHGKFLKCRVLLDSGSQVSFIIESFAQRLGLSRKHARIPIVGLSKSEAGFTKGCMSLQLFSQDSSSCLLTDAFVLKRLTSHLPSKLIDISCWSHISCLELADPHFNVPGPIDILLGADKLWSILKGEQIQGPIGLPVAQNTLFGWVIAGEVLEPTTLPISSIHVSVDVDGILQRFWELDDITPSKDIAAINDPAELHFRRFFSRAPKGKYIVQLPFKHSSPAFGETLKSAISRLLSMERRFKSHPDLHQSYTTFMREYLSLGHMERISPEDMETPCGKQFYLPHHAVFKSDSSSTKLRVVFDGSVKDSLGQSLNSQLLIGPPIQRDLLGVCLRFRQHRYVFTADIEKMFRQIWVDERHTNFQRIVWRESPDEEIQHFRLLTVTYGTASAPFLSVRVLKQLADDYSRKYPTASRVLLNDVYVDDVMTGTDSVESLIALQAELVELLSKARLNLRKWTSNCWPLLANLPQNDCEFCWTDPEQSNSLIKVLGMYWSPAKDMFSFRMSELCERSAPTRRTLLSEIAQIFDPLGFLAPSVILFKILFQELWSSEHKLGWDDQLPPPLARKWSQYRLEIRFFENISVPRNISSCKIEGIELHGFSDASSLAYAAVIYARCKISSNEFKTTIIAAKTKVAPLKPVTIPRLELCGALLLSRLFSLVQNSLTTRISKVSAWCDSEIVLHWLSSPPRRWNSFVANRTSTILETVPLKSWHHIASEFNPADCASRGILPSNLFNHSLWWTGPPWLSKSEEFWPNSHFNTIKISDENPIYEAKPLKIVSLVTTLENNNLQTLINKISSWYRLQRIVAWCYRTLPKRRLTNVSPCASNLSLREIQNAKKIIIKYVQNLAFENDINHLQLNKELPVKSKLIKYSPFLDTDGILRVGGRIKNAIVSYNIKHPIILPAKNHVSFLIVSDIHNNYLHTGVSATFTILRQQYWILGCRNLIRKIVHRCKACFMQRKATTTQLMGNLPMQRIQASRPFLNAGCDYAGPLTIKLSRGRNPKFSKAYIALFVCMSTKALHLEAVSDLTTDAFLAALRRFISRRGRCSNMYSDNGSNFKGARRCLDEMHKAIMSQVHNEEIATKLAKDGITWHFIPPFAPHFGGIWESGIRSVKLHLRRVLGNSVLTFEELYTVLTQIEAILNSRPLCSLSDNDFNPLTPAHFLVGEPLTVVPEPNLTDIPTNRLSHWNHLQFMVQGFWKRWHTEYLTSLQERPKWQQTTIDLKPGDLVVIKEPNLPPTKWLMGRIEAVNRGSDNRVRVATVRTTKGTSARSITKLAVLPRS